MSNYVLDLFRWIRRTPKFTGPNADLFRRAHESGWKKVRRTSGRWCHTLSKPTSVETVRGSVTAQPGDMICVSSDGKQFIDTRANVRRHYSATKQRKRIESRLFVWYIPQAHEVFVACQIDTPFEVRRDVDLIKGHRNDWIVLPVSADRRGGAIPIVIPDSLYPLVYH